MKVSRALIAICASLTVSGYAQQGTSVSGVVPVKKNWSQGMAASVMSWWNDSLAQNA